MPGTPETILAFDFGLRRIGIAVGQQVTQSASPLTTVANSDKGPDWRAVERIVNEWRPQRLIVGVPTRADGTPSEFGKLVDRFISDLCRFGLPVDSVDERYSSVEAGEMLTAQRAGGLRGRIRKENIDSQAAVLIAERWLKRASQ